MTKKTAQHLNALLAAAQPTVINDRKITGPGAEKMLPLFREVASHHENSVLRERIKHAAEGKQHVATNFGSAWDVSGCVFLEYDNDMWTACMPQWQALLDAHNAQALREYESYRVACAQGVAVPPQEVN